MVGKRALYRAGQVGKEPLQLAAETHESVGLIKIKGIVLHPFDGKSEFQRVGSTGQEGVVVELEGIPNVPTNSAGKAGLELRKASGKDGGRIPSRIPSQGRVLGGGINRRYSIAVLHVGPVETKPRAIDQHRAENVVPFQGSDVAHGLRKDIRVIKGVGVSVGCFVIHVRPEQVVLITNLVIHSDSKKIFVDNSDQGKDESACVLDTVVWS